MSKSASRPLSGIRVIEIGVALAGPWCAHVLGALGADVIKVEPPGGDEGRMGGPPPMWNGESPFFLAANANKRSVTLDLTRPEAVALVLRMVANSDVVLQNLRPGAMERLGLGFDRLLGAQARIVLCNIGAFGHRGPLADATAYDALIQGATGIMNSTRESPTSPPLRTGPAIIDMGTALWAVIGILAALRARDRDGHGHEVDTSLFEVGATWQPTQIVSYLVGGNVPPPPGRASIIYAPFQAFETRDGAIVVGAGTDRVFRRLCEALGLSDLSDDDRFSSNPERVAHQRELAAILQERFSEATTEEWLARLRALRLPAGPIQDIDALVTDEQFEALGLLQHVPHPRIAELQLVGPPVSFDGRRPKHVAPPPMLGEHTEEVLLELGCPREEIAALRRDAVVGGLPTGEPRVR
jgi:crotonobetainyl-CoA:carnitine CoA-transferase CaiB-like acyl-CoA transferase